MSQIEKEFLKCYQGLFDFFSDNYDIPLLMDEMDIIIKLVEETKEQLKKWEEK